MDITKVGDNGDVTEYLVLMSNVELDDMLSGVFQKFTPDKNISPHVLDVLIHEYMKSFVIHEFLNRVKILKGAIYKIKLVTTDTEKIIMLSHNEQSNTIFY